MKIHSHTMQSRVSNIDDANRWYTTLLGRSSDFSPQRTIHEWQLYPDCWLAVIEARPDPGRNRIRFGVDDMSAERVRIERELKIPVTDPIRVGDIVMYCDFEDPDGNRLGMFETLRS